MPPRTLSVVPTPLGHLGDITLRALETLKAADAILAEDTRVSRTLCAHYDITTPLRSYHQFSESSQLTPLLTQLRDGAHLALISDAGTPGISDPGARLINAVRADPDLTLEILPGATAVTTALLAAGFGDLPFAFLGFVPRKKNERTALWHSIEHSPLVSILYDSPRRIIATLAEAATALGSDREAAVAKELTKIHEATFRAPLGELTALIPIDALRGEFVLLIGPGDPAPAGAGIPPAELATLLLTAGLSPRGARAILARLAGLPASRAYDLLLEASQNAPPAAS